MVKTETVFERLFPGLKSRKRIKTVEAFVPVTLRTKEPASQILSEDFPSHEWPMHGGWGYTKEDAVVIDLESSGAGVAFEYRFIEYRTYEEMIIFRAKGHGYADIRVQTDRQTLYEEDGRAYDRLLFTVTGYPEAEFAWLKVEFKKLVELGNRRALRANIRELESLKVTYKTECWFDITAFFGK